MTDEDAMELPVRIDPTTLDRAGMTIWMTDAGPFDVLAARGWDSLTSISRVQNIRHVAP